MKSDEIAAQLHELRTQKGWSQEQLARKVGCSQQAISALEQPDYKRHSMPTLRRIAKALGMKVQVTLVPSKRTIRADMVPGTAYKPNGA